MNECLDGEMAGPPRGPVIASAMDRPGLVGYWTDRNARARNPRIDLNILLRAAVRRRAERCVRWPAGESIMAKAPALLQMWVDWMVEMGGGHYRRLQSGGDD